MAGGGQPAAQSAGVPDARTPCWRGGRPCGVGAGHQLRVGAIPAAATPLVRGRSAATGAGQGAAAEPVQLWHQSGPAAVGRDLEAGLACRLL